jgi:flagellar biosynthetic protein FliR
VNEAGPELVLGIAVVFARVAGVFLIAPGLSSMRVPLQARLFLALALALAVAPLVYDDAAAAVRGAAPATLLAVLGTETIIGGLIGLLARLLFMALQTMTVAIASFVGLGGIPGVSMDGEEGGGAVSNLFMTAAITAIFLSDLHYEVLRGVVGSYAVLAPGAALDAQAALVAVADRIEEAFAVGLRLASPFLLYSVVVNFAVGIVNKLTPQLPVYFVALPLVTAGGLLMMTLAAREFLLAVIDAFDQLAVAL